METNVVQAVLLDFQEHRHPRVDIGWRVAGLGKTAVFDRTAQEERAAVDVKLSALDADIAQSEGGGVLVIAGQDGQLV